mmetsp:Transcript_1954/g.2949  ORF Transcript_1954/g.2949 Transcript_1954/m.2949 type:complete len:222 (-) Transcript_1954:92-757(-)
MGLRSWATVFLAVAFGKPTPEDGLKFLEENKNKEGVITLPSGLQYKVLREGDGADSPTVSTPCECHYEGTLIDGEKFDSSYDRGSPTTFAPNQVIKGWTEAMQLMVEGDKWEMYIPSELAYGERGSPPKIPGGSVLIFKMEILKIKGEKKPANRCKVASLEGCDDKQKTYIEKQKSKDQASIEKELARLQKMSSGQMKPEQSVWISKRLHILQQLKAKDEL